MRKHITLKQRYQIKKLKKLCNCCAYFAGSEMYRLLHYEVLQEMVTKIEPVNTTLASTLLFGKKVISPEEQFLYLLNKYIIFIRNQCFINANELICIIEETLKSDYSAILFSHLDFHTKDNSSVFQREFKKMFLDSLFSNFQKFFGNKYPLHPLAELNQYSLDDEEQLDKLFHAFRGIINFRRSNLYNFFVKETEEIRNDEDKQILFQKQWFDLIEKYMLVRDAMEIVGLS